MTNWQPIETAPKDGTSILLSYVVSFSGGLKQSLVTEARWFSEMNYRDSNLENLTPNDFSHGWASYIHCDTSDPKKLHVMFLENSFKKVTHWMPLPDPFRAPSEQAVENYKKRQEDKNQPEPERTVKFKPKESALNERRWDGNGDESSTSLVQL